MAAWFGLSPTGSKPSRNSGGERRPSDMDISDDEGNRDDDVTEISDGEDSRRRCTSTDSYGTSVGRCSSNVSYGSGGRYSSSDSYSTSIGSSNSSYDSSVRCSSTDSYGTSVGRCSSRDSYNSVGSYGVISSSVDSHTTTQEQLDSTLKNIRLLEEQQKMQDQQMKMMEYMKVIKKRNVDGGRVVSELPLKQQGTEKTPEVDNPLKQLTHGTHGITNQSQCQTPCPETSGTQCSPHQTVQGQCLSSQRVPGQYLQPQNVYDQYTSPQNVNGQLPTQNVQGKFPTPNLYGECALPQNVPGPFAPPRTLQRECLPQDVQGLSAPTSNVHGLCASSPNVQVQQPIQNVLEQQALQNIKGQQPLQNVLEQWVLQNIKGQQPLQNVQEQCLPQDVQGLSAPTSNVHGLCVSSPNVQGQQPLQNVQEQQALQNVQEQQALQNVQGQQPLQNVQEQQALQNVQEQCLPQDVQGLSAPTSNIHGLCASSQNVHGQQPLQNVQEQQVLQNVQGQQPLQNVQEQQALQNVQEQCLPQDVQGLSAPTSNVHGLCASSPNEHGQQPLQIVQEQQALQNVQGQQPLQNVQEQQALQNVQEQCLPQDVQGLSAPTSNVHGLYASSPNVHGQQPLQNVQGQWPAQNTYRQLPPQITEGQCVPSQYGQGQCAPGMSDLVYQHLLKRNTEIKAQSFPRSSQVPPEASEPVLESLPQPSMPELSQTPVSQGPDFVYNMPAADTLNLTSQPYFQTGALETYQSNLQKWQQYQLQSYQQYVIYQQQCQFYQQQFQQHPQYPPQAIQYYYQQQQQLYQYHNQQHYQQQCSSQQQYHQQHSSKQNLETHQQVQQHSIKKEEILKSTNRDTCATTAQCPARIGDNSDVQDERKSTTSDVHSPIMDSDKTVSQQKNSTRENQENFIKGQTTETVASPHTDAKRNERNFEDAPNTPAGDEIVCKKGEESAIYKEMKEAAEVLQDTEEQAKTNDTSCLNKCMNGTHERNIDASMHIFETDKQESMQKRAKSRICSKENHIGASENIKKLSSPCLQDENPKDIFKAEDIANTVNEETRIQNDGCKKNRYDAEERDKGIHLPCLKGLNQTQGNADTSTSEKNQTRGNADTSTSEKNQTRGNADTSTSEKLVVLEITYTNISQQKCGSNENQQTTKEHAKKIGRSCLKGCGSNSKETQKALQQKNDGSKEHQQNDGSRAHRHNNGFRERHRKDGFSGNKHKDGSREPQHNNVKQGDGSSGHQQKDGSLERQQDGSRERQQKDGSREHQREDGSREPEQEDGFREHQQEGGSRERQQEDGSREHQLEDGSRERQQADGSKERQQEDGSGEDQQEDGSRECQQEDGSREPEQEDGSREIQQKDGSREPEQQDGSRERQQEDDSRERQQKNDMKPATQKKKINIQQYLKDRKSKALSSNKLMPSGTSCNTSKISKSKAVIAKSSEADKAVHQQANSGKGNLHNATVSKKNDTTKGKRKAKHQQMIDIDGTQRSVTNCTKKMDRAKENKKAKHQQKVNVHQQKVNVEQAKESVKDHAKNVEIVKEKEKAKYQQKLDLESTQESDTNHAKIMDSAKEKKILKHQQSIDAEETQQSITNCAKKMDRAKENKKAEHHLKINVERAQESVTDHAKKVDKANEKDTATHQQMIDVEIAQQSVTNCVKNIDEAKKKDKVKHLLKKDVMRTTHRTHISVMDHSKKVDKSKEKGEILHQREIDIEGIQQSVTNCAKKMERAKEKDKTIQLQKTSVTENCQESYDRSKKPEAANKEENLMHQKKINKRQNIKKHAKAVPSTKNVNRSPDYSFVNLQITVVNESSVSRNSSDSLTKHSNSLTNQITVEDGVYIISSDDEVDDDDDDDDDDDEVLEVFSKSQVSEEACKNKASVSQKSSDSSAKSSNLLAGQVTEPAEDDTSIISSDDAEDDTSIISSDDAEDDTSIISSNDAEDDTSIISSDDDVLEVLLNTPVITETRQNVSSDSQESSNNLTKHSKSLTSESTQHVKKSEYILSSDDEVLKLLFNSPEHEQETCQRCLPMSHHIRYSKTTDSKMDEHPVPDELSAAHLQKLATYQLNPISAAWKLKLKLGITRCDTHDSGKKHLESMPTGIRKRALIESDSKLNSNDNCELKLVEVGDDKDGSRHSKFKKLHALKTDCSGIKVKHRQRSGSAPGDDEGRSSQYSKSRKPQILQIDDGDVKLKQRKKSGSALVNDKDGSTKYHSKSYKSQILKTDGSDVKVKHGQNSGSSAVGDDNDGSNHHSKSQKLLKMVGSDVKVKHRQRSGLVHPDGSYKSHVHLKSGNNDCLKLRHSADRLHAESKSDERNCHLFKNPRQESEIICLDSDAEDDNEDEARPKDVQASVKAGTRQWVFEQHVRPTPLQRCVATQTETDITMNSLKSDSMQNTGELQPSMDAVNMSGFKPNLHQESERTHGKRLSSISKPKESHAEQIFDVNENEIVNSIHADSGSFPDGCQVKPIHREHNIHKRKEHTGDTTTIHTIKKCQKEHKAESGTAPPGTCAGGTQPKSNQVLDSNIGGKKLTARKHKIPCESVKELRTCETSADLKKRKLSHRTRCVQEPNPGGLEGETNSQNKDKMEFASSAQKLHVATTGDLRTDTNTSKTKSKILKESTGSRKELYVSAAGEHEKMVVTPQTPGACKRCHNEDILRRQTEGKVSVKKERKHEKQELVLQTAHVKEEQKKQGQVVAELGENSIRSDDLVKGKCRRMEVEKSCSSMGLDGMLHVEKVTDVKMESERSTDQSLKRIHNAAKEDSEPACSREKIIDDDSQDAKYRDSIATTKSGGKVRIIASSGGNQPRLCTETSKVKYEQTSDDARHDTPHERNDVQPQSDHHVWIIGDFIMEKAYLRAKQLNDGHLGLSRIDWHTSAEACVGQKYLKRKLSQTRSDIRPNFIVIHLGANDLMCTDFKKFSVKVDSLIMTVKKYQPLCHIIWSSMPLQCLSSMNFSIKQIDAARIQANKMVKEQFGFHDRTHIISYDHVFKRSSRAMYETDGQGLSLRGVDNFLTVLRTAVGEFVRNPEQKYFPDVE